MVHTLSNEDATKHEKVYEMNMFYCLDVLSYLQDKRKYEEDQHNRQMAKYKYK